MTSTGTSRRAARRATAHGWWSERATTARRGAADDEAGAVLILALIFLIAVGGIVGSLAGWVTNDLNNNAHFTSARSLQYAAESAVELAIQNIRYTPQLSTSQTLNASPAAACWGTSGTSQLPTTQGTTTENVAVWCSTVWNPSLATTRVVTFSACPVTSNETNVSCAANPYLQAVVTFDDYPTGVVSAPTTAECVVYCGTGETVDSWDWSPLVPSVSGISPSTGSIIGGTAVTISGTGFTSGATVNFVEENGTTPTSDNVVLAGTHVNVISATSITAVAPSVITGSTYFVTVTAPGGTSAYASNVFTYTPVVPTVNGFGATSPTQGPTSGGTAVTISGMGFVTGASVNFTEENGNSLVSPTVTLPATSVLVSSDTTITAVTPAVIVGTTYFVTVTTPTGTSTSTSNAVFKYLLPFPVVSSIAPPVGLPPGGTSLVITGTGFFTGATVTFVEESGGTATSPAVSVPATNVVVTSSTTITAISPLVTVGTTYFVAVTTSAGTSSNSVVFTY